MGKPCGKARTPAESALPCVFFLPQVLRSQPEHIVHTVAARRAVRGLPKDDAQIGHAMAARCATVDLKRPKGADEAGIENRLAPLRKQHFGNKHSARQKADECPAHGIRMTTQRSPLPVSPADDGVEILVPKEGEFSELLQPSLYQPAEQCEISSRRRITNLPVNVQVEHTHAGQLRSIEPLVEVARQPLQVGALLP